MQCPPASVLLLKRVIKSPRSVCSSSARPHFLCGCDGAPGSMPGRLSSLQANNSPSTPCKLQTRVSALSKRDATSSAMLGCSWSMLLAPDLAKCWNTSASSPFLKAAALCINQPPCLNRLRSLSLSVRADQLPTCIAMSAMRRIRSKTLDGWTVSSIRAKLVREVFPAMRATIAITAETSLKTSAAAGSADWICAVTSVMLALAGLPVVFE
eukprot:UN1162